MAQLKIQEQEDAYKGVYPSVFKKIDMSDVAVNPFLAYKSWTIYSGSATSSALPLRGFYTDVNVLPALGSELTYNDAKNADGSLQSVTYFSINHLYYKHKGDPSKTYGPTNLTRTKKFLFQSASILSIPQIRIGEGIKPASFTFTSSVSGSYTSDRYGNIIDVAFNTNSIVPDVGKNVSVSSSNRNSKVVPRSPEVVGGGTTGQAKSYPVAGSTTSSIPDRVKPISSKEFMASVSSRILSFPETKR